MLRKESRARQICVNSKQTRSRKWPSFIACEQIRNFVFAVFSQLRSWPTVAGTFDFKIFRHLHIIFKWPLGIPQNKKYFMLILVSIIYVAVFKHFLVRLLAIRWCEFHF